MLSQKEENEGWKKELLKSMKDKRDAMVQAKLDAIFGAARSARSGTHLKTCNGGGVCYCLQIALAVLSPPVTFVIHVNG